MFPGVSDSCLKANAKGIEMNPMNYAMGKPAYQLRPNPKPKKRLRQDTKPLLNNLEQRFYRYLQCLFPGDKIVPQGKRYRLANGLWYKPDFTAVMNVDPVVGWMEYAWEVKGPHAFRGGFENLKMAAATYPQVFWTLAWFDSGWMTQRILQ